MRILMGLVLAGGLLLGSTSQSEAQFSLAIGSPYAGQGVYIGTPGYVGGYGYPSYGVNSYTGYSSGLGYPGYAGYAPGYASGYNNYYNSAYVVRPGNFGYSSGYRGFASPLGAYGYGVRPNYGYGYGYGGYGYRPFRGNGRFFR
jgi:hypothetical protein